MCPVERGGNPQVIAMKQQNYSGWWWYTYPNIWKNYSSQLGLLFPTEWEVKKVMFHSTNKTIGK